MPNTPLWEAAISAMLPGMFLRRKTKSARGVGYSYWHLCETVRTARGPRQRVVASLGKLDQADVEGLRGGWDDLRSLLRGEPGPAKTADLPGLEAASAAEPAARWERADLSGLRVERTRDFGESYLGLSLWHRLKLDELLAAVLPAGRESVAWAHTAALLTVARFCAQRSELGVATGCGRSTCSTTAAPTPTRPSPARTSRKNLCRPSAAATPPTCRPGRWPGQADDSRAPSSNQLVLFDGGLPSEALAKEGWQPDAPAGDPGFWPGAGVQEFPEDDFVQPAPDEA